MSSKWKLILILGPSGAWKGTLLSLLKERRPDFFYPVSATSRAIREGEKEGETYHFVSEEKFEKMIEEGEFLEYAVVHKKWHYGTLKKPILNAIFDWKIVVREIDVQGFDSISKNLNKDLFSSIFILPPSEEILRKRITERAPISKEELDSRMESLKKEILYKDRCSAILEQDEIEKMYENLEKLIQSLISFKL